MRSQACATFAAGVLAAVLPAQDKSQTSREQALERRLDALQKEVDALKSARGGTVHRGSAIGGTGSGGTRAPDAVAPSYAELAKAGMPLPQDEVASAGNEKIKIGGRLDFEFYDIDSQPASRGAYVDPDNGGTNTFGASSGPTEFRVRRLELGLDLELIEDFNFRTTLTLDPVVRDQDEGAVDIDEAYVRFSNIVRNLFGYEDPSHAFVQAGNYYQWERSFLHRWSESYSLAGTSFYRDEVTGLAVGGDFEFGLLWRFSLDNGHVLTARDAGVGARRGGGGSAVGNSPIFHDNEQLGDVDNHKAVAFGVGWENEVEEPKLQYGVALSYRVDRLSGAERSFLAGISPTYDGSSRQQRFGVLFTAEWDLEDFLVGGNAELWFAEDGNAQRELWSVAPYARLPLDGVYYQQRLFFTGIGAGYRWSGLHMSRGFANTNPANAQTHILDDRHMHTVGVWLDVTRNVDLRLELNNIDPNNGQSGTETEWLVQWSVRF